MGFSSFGCGQLGCDGNLKSYLLNEVDNDFPKMPEIEVMVGQIMSSVIIGSMNIFKETRRFSILL
jgi:hypothetical protein